MLERMKFTSPAGEALEVMIHETEKDNGRDTGNFIVKLVLAGEALETVTAQVEAFIVASYGPKMARRAKRPFKTTKDGGKTFITFKAKAELKGVPRPIAIYDSKGNPVIRQLKIGSGSIVKVKGVMSAWDDEPGVSFYMDAVQVIKYVEANPYGFEPYQFDDGFVDT